MYTCTYVYEKYVRLCDLVIGGIGGVCSPHCEAMNSQSL